MPVFADSLSYLEYSVYKNLEKTHSMAKSLPINNNWIVYLSIEKDLASELWGTIDFHTIDPFVGTLKNKTITWQDSIYTVEKATENKIVLIYKGNKKTYIKLKDDLNTFVNLKTIAGKYLSSEKEKIEFQPNGTLIKNGIKIGRYEINPEPYANKLDIFTITFPDTYKIGNLENTYISIQDKRHEKTAYYSYTVKDMQLYLFSLKPYHDGFLAGKIIAELKRCQTTIKTL